MSKNNYIFLITTLLFTFSFGKLNATTEDGKKVILRNDGTWIFESPAENAKFNLVEFVDARFEKHDKHFGREKKPYNAHVRGFFKFQNNSDRKVVAIKYKFALVDAFDEILYESIVKDNVIIDPGYTNNMDTYYYWEDTFSNDDVYDKIIGPVSSNNLKRKINLIMIVFDNGTKIQYN